jgi:hypothetical protein
LGAFRNFLKLLGLCTRAAPNALLRHFGTPKFICMFSAMARAQDWCGGLKRKNAFPKSLVANSDAGRFRLHRSNVRALAASSIDVR